MEAKAVKHLDKFIRLHEENKCEAELPGIEGHPDLHSNLEVAEKNIFVYYQNASEIKEDRRIIELVYAVRKFDQYLTTHQETKEEIS